MNRNIIHIAFPAIIANITIPLLGFIDTSIAGHLGNTVYIGAIAVGAMMFNLIYWNFGFLRMGTSGLTAQAFGANDLNEAARLLLRSSALALLISLTILILQYPLQWIALELIGPSPNVTKWAQSYFFVCVWNAPAILIMMAIKGWFLGMQDSTRPMFISIGVNIANIIVSLLAVFVFKMGFIGVAVGTVTASYIGLAFAIILIYRYHSDIIKLINWREALHIRDLKRFFSINSDIFFRSLCLMLVTLFFTARGARSGDVILAANTIIMQLFIMFSYFMDGFAFAGEALVGKYTGSADNDARSRCIRLLFIWGIGIAALFTISYAAGLKPIFYLLTNDQTVINAALDYYWWCIAIPFAGMAAFVWDGVYIGLTATRQMLVSIFIASLSFMAVYYLQPGEADNNRLWLAFITYLAMRGISQTFLYRYVIKKAI